MRATVEDDEDAAVVEGDTDGDAGEAGHSAGANSDGE